LAEQADGAPARTAGAPRRRCGRRPRPWTATEGRSVGARRARRHTAASCPRPFLSRPCYVGSVDRVRGCLPTVAARWPPGPDPLPSSVRGECNPERKWRYSAKTRSESMWKVKENNKTEQQLQCRAPYDGQAPRAQAGEPQNQPQPTDHGGTARPASPHLRSLPLPPLPPPPPPEPAARRQPRSGPSGSSARSNASASRVSKDCRLRRRMCRQQQSADASEQRGGRGEMGKPNRIRNVGGGESC